MNPPKDDKWGILAPLRILITFSVAGVAVVPIVALVSIIDTWWMVALGALYMLCATGVLLAVILTELDRDEGSQPR
jgi:hypothetical protein